MYRIFKWLHKKRKQNKKGINVHCSLNSADNRLLTCNLNCKHITVFYILSGRNKNVIQKFVKCKVLYSPGILWVYFHSHKEASNMGRGQSSASGCCAIGSISQTFSVLISAIMLAWCLYQVNCNLLISYEKKGGSVTVKTLRDTSINLMVTDSYISQQTYSNTVTTFHSSTNF